MDEEEFTKVPVHCKCGAYKTYVGWADTEELIEVHFVVRCPMCQLNYSVSWTSLGDLHVMELGSEQEHVSPL